MSKAQLDEPILPDDYPIYCGYAYVADGQVVINQGPQTTAERFKRENDFAELRRCDLVARGLLK